MWGVPALAGAVLLSLHFSFFSWSIIDDSFITFRYARNLLRHGELAYNTGVRSEGYSNFLWMLQIAAGMRLGWNPVPFAKALGFAHLLALFFLALWTLGRIGGGPSRPGPDLAAGLFLAVWLGCSHTLASHAQGGMETPQHALLLAAAFAAAIAPVRSARGERAAAWAIATLASLVALNRPEGIAYYPFILAARLLQCASPAQALGLMRRRWLAWLAPPSVFAALELFRLAYFGEPFPLTVGAKALPLQLTIRYGAGYLLLYLERGGTAWTWLLLAGALAWAVGRAPGPERRQIAGLALLVAANAGFVLKAGSDWMANSRFLAPAEFPIALILAWALKTLLGAPALSVRWRQARPAALATFLAGAGAMAFGTASCSLEARFQDLFQYRTKKARPLFTAWHYLKTGTVFRGAGFLNTYELLSPFMLERVAPGQTIVAADIGLIGYSLDCRLIDTNGLVTPEVSRWLGALARDPGSPAEVEARARIEALLDEAAPDWIFMYSPDETGETPILPAEHVVLQWLRRQSSYERVLVQQVKAQDCFIAVRRRGETKRPAPEEIERNFLRLIDALPENPEPWQAWKDWRQRRNADFASLAP